MNWQFKMEDRASVADWRHPNPAAVALNDRMADGEAHPHPSRFGREQRLENPMEVGWINSSSRILNRYMHQTGLGLISLYFQHARPNRLHGLDGIHDEVQDDLLQLHLVALYGQEMLAELCVKLYVMFLQLNTHNRQNCQDDLVDVSRYLCRRILFEHRAHAGDDVAGAMAGSHNALQCCFCPFKIGLLRADPP